MPHDDDDDDDNDDDDDALLWWWSMAVLELPVETVSPTRPYTPTTTTVHDKRIHDQ